MKKMKVSDEALQGLVGYLVWARRASPKEVTDADVRVILEHDLGGLWHNEPCLLPRTHGFKQYAPKPRYDEEGNPNG